MKQIDPDLKKTLEGYVDRLYSPIRMGTAVGRDAEINLAKLETTRYLLGMMGYSLAFSLKGKAIVDVQRGKVTNF